MSVRSPGLFVLMATQITIADTYTSDWSDNFTGCEHLSVQFRLEYGSGGSTCSVFLQSSIDDGETAYDIGSFQFTTGATRLAVISNAIAQGSAFITPGDAALTNNTFLHGLVGPRLRAKAVVTGTYAGSTVVSVRVNAR